MKQSDFSELLNLVDKKRERFFSSSSNRDEVKFAASLLGAGMAGAFLGATAPIQGAIIIPAAIAYAVATNGFFSARIKDDEFEQEQEQRMQYVRLMNASMSGDADAVTKLLDKNSFSDEQISEALAYASLKNQNEVVLQLIEAGAKASFKDDKAIKWAEFGNAPEVVETLEKQKAKELALEKEEEQKKASNTVIKSIEDEPEYPHLDMRA